MITRAQLIDVLFVIVPHSLLLDIAGPAEAFRLANQHRERRGLPPRFRLRFAGPESAPATSVGLALADLEPLPEELPHADLGRGGRPAGRPRHPGHAGDRGDRAVAATTGCATRSLDADTPHRLVTICSGTLLAARAGLLASRRCTTHHELLHSCAPWRRRRR